jgi:hypothetical protein
MATTVSKLRRKTTTVLGDVRLPGGSSWDACLLAEGTDAVFAPTFAVA